MLPCPVCGQQAKLISTCQTCGGKTYRIDHSGHPWFGVEFQGCKCQQESSRKDAADIGAE